MENAGGFSMQGNNRKLFTVSFLMLFLELLLIRWISTEVRIFAYVSNLVLLACFLGIGAGCYLAKKEANIFITLAMLVLIALSVKCLPFIYITDMLGGFADSIIWFQFQQGSLSVVLQGVVLTIYLFLMILVAFIPLGQLLGSLLDDHRTIIAAYSINIIGSLIGIWAFSLLSFYYTPPWVWLLCALFMLFFFIPRSKRYITVFAAASVLCLLVTGTHNPDRNLLWSPYQKLEVRPSAYKGVPNGYLITVNSVSYMSATNLSREFLQGHPSFYDPGILKYNQYEIPYLFHNTPDRVLIVGAGAGNDIAGALRNNAGEIDAVEIDPGIHSLGAQLHPERPYQNPRVHIVIDDARAYFKKTNKKYDLIVFGLLDSHTLSSQYNNMRLDHYVYTEESFREAKKLLKDDGILVVSFSAQRDWIGTRLNGVLKKVFGEVPYTFTTMLPTESFLWGSLMFITSNNPAKIKQRVEARPELRDYVRKNIFQCSGAVKLISDDWPYLYIETPSIPHMYLLIIIALVVLFIAAYRLMGSAGEGGINWHFFFLGAAFMLLEFQNVSKATLLFGSTWMVNAYIISAILVLILLSNMYAYYLPAKNILPAYIILLTSVLVLYFIPVDIFNNLGYAVKALAGAFILNVPIFFAGRIFITSFSSTEHRDQAFGSNLMGAALGGLLEPLSFVTGIKALLLVVLLLYALSYLFSAQNRRQLI